MMILDITLTTEWLFAIGIGVIFFFLHLYLSNKQLKKEKDNYNIEANKANNQLQFVLKENESKLKEQLLEFQKKEAELKVSYQDWAIAEFNYYKKTEIEKIQKNADSQAIHKASVLLQEWKIENEAKIRQDAINRSYSVNLGKITEHLIPFHQTFLNQFNPKDARFIGSPIDLIVFDGYADKRDELVIYLVEIKTGNSKLSNIQKKIKEATLKGNIRWAEVNYTNQQENTSFEENLEQQSLNNKSCLDLGNEDDIEELIASIIPNENETDAEILNKVTEIFQTVENLTGKDDYTIYKTILNKINSLKLSFKLNYKFIFINSLKKLIK